MIGFNQIIDKIIGRKLIRTSELNRKSLSPTFANLWCSISEEQKKIIQPYLLETNSQIAQDLFVLSQLGTKSSGYFVEVGAADGIANSNTLLFEKKLNWKGLLVEPCRSSHIELNKNRDCHIDQRAAFSQSDLELNFIEMGKEKIDSVYQKQFSHLSINDNNNLPNKHKESNYKVKTIRLSSLLDEINAPNNIDYLSIDTESTEPQVLAGIDFCRYKFKVITIEHNFINKNRSIIYKRLSSLGYKRVFKEISRWDDWYIYEK